MSYLEEFQLLLDSQQFSNFVRLWEEYCLSDEVEGDELIKILLMIKESDFAKPFGQIAETVIPMWQKMEDQPPKDKVLSLILDLQTTNAPRLADYAMEYLKRHFPEDKNFNEKSRIVGLRSRHNFQGAIANFELLSHMNKDHFVFHTGGWGVGEVMDISLLREHVVLEFEGITALKDISFENAFKNLIPLPSDHFLAKRFGDPDTLEKEGKEDPAKLMRLVLKDLGPKTAAEIKDELCVLVIPEEDWSKWWQQARAKIKKDTFIKTPKSLKESFALRVEALSHEDRFLEALKGIHKSKELIQTVYHFTRDFSEVCKDEEVKKSVKNLLNKALENLEPYLTDEEKVARQIQISFLLEDLFPKEYPGLVNSQLEPIQDVEQIIEKIEVVALKKRTLTFIREKHSDWTRIFLNLLFTIAQNPLRDYLFKELFADDAAKQLLLVKLKDLLAKVSLYPEAFLWYFQKITTDKEVPYADIEHKRQFLEAFMILLHYVEMKSLSRDLLKKMHHILTAKRYLLVRTIIKDANIEYLKEFLLLASKCQTLSKHDMRILHSLAEVVAPALGKKKRDKEKKQQEKDTLWTTPQGYQKLQEKIQQIGTKEIVDNAREIEAARALGDLRENAEYKFALERRSRLQAELKTLTKQMQKARILRKEDITTREIGIGGIVDLQDKKGNVSTYTLLGPWDADPDQNVLSFQSKLAQAMIGHKVGDHFAFQGEEFTVKKIRSFL